MTTRLTRHLSDGLKKNVGESRCKQETVEWKEMKGRREGKNVSE